jgi:hypothetical protein
VALANRPDHPGETGPDPEPTPTQAVKTLSPTSPEAMNFRSGAALACGLG